MTTTETTLETVNPQDAKLFALQELFPEAFREGKLDPMLLSASLGDAVSHEKEAYGMTWAGKRDARRQILAPTSHTLTGDEDASVKWDTTQNILIEGDNLTVLKLVQKGYTKQVKMIYIDPPYNTGKDFVYHDNFHADREDYETTTGQRDSEGQKLVQNTETNGRYHSDWLSMMYPRLHLARNLLRDDGVIFVSIDDHEVHNLRKIMDEVFGEENFEGSIHWRRRHNQPNDKTKMIGLVAEHIIAYAKNSSLFKQSGVGKIDLTGDFSNPDNDPRGNWASKPWKTGSDQNGSRYKIVSSTGKEFDEEWMGEETTYQSLLSDNRIIFPKKGDGFPRKKYFYYERKEEGQCATNWWSHEDFGHNQGANDLLSELFGAKNIFTNPKPIKLIRGFLQIANTDKNDLILDFFAGSGTTGHAVMALNAEEKAEAVKNGTNPDEVGNRRYICVQLPEVTNEKSEAFKAGYLKISDITAERLRRAGTKIAEENPTLTLDTGFRLYRLGESCYQIAQVQYDSDNEQSTLESFEKALASGLSPLREGVSEADVITENFLKEGFLINTSLSEVKIGETHFLHANNEGKQLYISFDGTIPLTTIDALQKGYKESICVVYDSALTDPLKVMLASRVTLRTV